MTRLRARGMLTDMSTATRIVRAPRWYVNQGVPRKPKPDRVLVHNRGMARAGHAGRRARPPRLVAAGRRSTADPLRVRLRAEDPGALPG